jgi:hypothetical protein
MRAALSEVDSDAPSQIFLPNPDFPTPILRKHVTKRTLIFPGSFNPLHIGHKLLLTHAFFRSGIDKVVAAMISPNGHKAVRRKFRQEKDTLFLTRQERGRLWADQELMPWSWVNPYSSRVTDGLEGALVTVAEADGFDIEFVHVVGGDHVDKAAARYRPNKDSLEPIVVLSDGLRSVLRHVNGSPMTLVVIIWSVANI